MSFEGLLAAALLLLISTAWVALPFLRRQTVQRDQDMLMQKQRERLDVLYRQVTTTIRDLDEDFSTGKIQEDDYQRERQYWLERGVQILKAQEQIDTGHVPLTTMPDEPDPTDDAIEAAVARYLEKAKS
jgi:hypothetical protein